MNKYTPIDKLLWAINRVTAAHRSGQKANNKSLDKLVDAQIEAEDYLEQLENEEKYAVYGYNYTGEIEQESVKLSKSKVIEYYKNCKIRNPDEHYFIMKDINIKE